MEVPRQRRAHIVLVHGACHGAWCWYKLKPLLEAAGHHVTVLDLSASGIDPRSLNDVRTLADYTTPLLEIMDSIPSNEKVVLVGHSLGGLNLAVAMEKYTEKIGVAVFLAAFMPDAKHGPSYVLDQGIMKIMNGLDRTALMRSEAANQAEEARDRVKTLSRELTEFKEVHSATIDSLKAECDRVRGEMEEQRRLLEAARTEVLSSRAELEAYKGLEADRHQAFLKSKEFQEILGPKAFKFLKIGFQNCQDQYTEAGLTPTDAATEFPDIMKAIASVPADILEDDPEGDEGSEAGNHGAEGDETKKVEAEENRTRSRVE